MKFTGKYQKNNCNLFWKTLSFTKKSEFKSCLSSEQAIAALLLKINGSLNNSNYVWCIFYNIKKAFDTLNRSIFFEKWKNSGIREKALDLIKSYLRNPGFHVEVQGRLSRPNSLDDIGVPGGLTWTLVGQLVKWVWIY